MKKNKKRGVILFLVFVFLLTATGCDMKNESGEKSTESSAEDIAGESSGETEFTEKIKVTLCVESNSDLSLNQSVYEGVMKVGSDLAQWYEITVVEMGSDRETWPAQIYQAADKKADIIIGTGYHNRSNFENIPMEYPDTMFILLDQIVDYNYADLSNVLTVLFNSNEAGFLAGAAAAYYTTAEQATSPEHKVIGFIGGEENVNTNDFLVGFVQGARYVEPDVKILRSYVGDAGDTNKAKQLAAEQIVAGADVVFHAAGRAGNGMMEACTEVEGVMAIGMDSDQFETLSGTSLESVIMTSALKKADLVIYQILSEYTQDATQIPFGKTLVYGLEQSAVGLVFNDNLSAGIGEENTAQIRMMITKICQGEIEVLSARRMSAEELDALVENKN